MSERIEVRTKAAAEKAIKDGKPIHIVAGGFALTLVGLTGIDIHVSANVEISMTDTRGVLVAKADSAPRIETWETSAPRIETWETSAPSIVTRGTSAPRIETWGTSAPRIETWETSAPSINNSDNPVPLIFLSGFRWRITISATRMAIGCQDHELVRWWSFDDRVIERMDGYALEFWRANKAHLQAICAATGRPSEPTSAEASELSA